MRNFIFSTAISLLLSLSFNQELLESHQFPVTFDWQSFIVRVIKKQILIRLRPQTDKNKKKPH